MLLNVIVHKSNTSIGGGGGGKYRRVSVIGVLEKNIGSIVDKDGMVALSMEILIVGKTCSIVVGPFES